MFETPADDQHTSTFIVIHSDAPVDRAKNIALLGLDDARFYSEKDCTYRATWDDRLGQDRTRMKDSWTGLHGIEQEDAAMSLSMGPIIDRSQEHLVPADRAVVTLRKLLLRSAKNVEDGGDPVAMPGDITDVRAPDVFLHARHAREIGWTSCLATGRLASGPRRRRRPPLVDNALRRRCTIWVTLNALAALDRSVANQRIRRAEQP